MLKWSSAFGNIAAAAAVVAVVVRVTTEVPSGDQKNVLYVARHCCKTRI